MLNLPGPNTLKAKRPIHLLGLVLLLATIAAFITTTCASQGTMLQNFAMNVTTELGGITLTVWVIDRVLRWQEEQREQKSAAIALKQANRALAKHVDVWAGLFKASIPARPEQLPVEFKQLLTPENIAHVAFFNVCAAAPTHPTSLWRQHLLNEIVRFQKEVERIIDKYAVFLAPEQIDLLERCANSNFCSGFPQLLSVGVNPGIAIFIAHVDGQKHTTVNPMLIEHLQSVDALLEHISQTLEDHRIGRICESTWSDIVGPQFGSARLHCPQNPPTT